MSTKLYPKRKIKIPKPDWLPKEKEFYKSFIKNLENFDEKSKKILTEETKSILGKCISPNTTTKSKNTGLVIGYVQSGKTTSFNALTMLALDNGFKLVIVLGGRTLMLTEQNRSEFHKNLEFFLDKGEIRLPENQTITDIKNINLNHLIQNHNDFPSTPIITVHLKHQQHIRQLTSVLKKDEFRDIIDSTNVLVIDDEADSASLNSKVKKDGYSQSAVYAAIKDLRRSLKKHSYVQYTATPQALLLVQRSDHMSPDWIRFISPGKKYVGTNDIFKDDSVNVQIIPDNDLVEENTDNFEITASLFRAIYSFLIVASQSVKDRKKQVWDKNISLLIHPSHLTKVQNELGELIYDHLNDWKYLMNNNKKQWIKEHKSKFKDAYNDLNHTSKDLNSFEDLFDLIPFIIQKISLAVLNKSGNKLLPNKINWDQDNFNILIGGNLLDRGYVVKGLVTTYMPRKGSYNADTLQQRGRFYGYKRNYLNYIRVWLGKGTLQKFQDYRRSESILYDDLKYWILNNQDKSVHEWKRRFILSPKLQPCRSSVVGIDIHANPNKKGWWWPKKPLNIKRNKNLITSLIEKYNTKFIKYPNSEDWNKATKPLVAKDISLNDLINYIVDYEIDSVDSDQWAITLATLGILSEKGYKASIILMGTEEPNLENFVSRSRTLSKKEREIDKYDEFHGKKYTENESYFRLNNFFQGRNGTGYPGGREIFDKSKKTITIQVHNITVKYKDSPKEYDSAVLAIKTPPSANLITEIDNYKIYE